MKAFSSPTPSCRVDDAFWCLTRDRLASAHLTLPETSSLLLAIKRFKGELAAASPQTVVQRRSVKVPKVRECTLACGKISTLSLMHPCRSSVGSQRHLSRLPRRAACRT